MNGHVTLRKVIDFYDCHMNRSEWRKTGRHYKRHELDHQWIGGSAKKHKGFEGRGPPCSQRQNALIGYWPIAASDKCISVTSHFFSLKERGKMCQSVHMRGRWPWVIGAPHCRLRKERRPHAPQTGDQGPGWHGDTSHNVHNRFSN